ncbi:MAG: mechanosensitive ion channel family protein [Alphaproteobacteria bacterium]|nr:mechanosensitive ion channel family protein [Alphaproteobacteria bacterium]
MMKLLLAITLLALSPARAQDVPPPELPPPPSAGPPEDAPPQPVEEPPPPAQPPAEEPTPSESPEAPPAEEPPTDAAPVEPPSEEALGIPRPDTGLPDTQAPDDDPQVEEAPPPGPPGTPAAVEPLPPLIQPPWRAPAPLIDTPVPWVWDPPLEPPTVEPPPEPPAETPDEPPAETPDEPPDEAPAQPDTPPPQQAETPTQPQPLVRPLLPEAPQPSGGAVIAWLLAGLLGLGLSRLAERPRQTLNRRGVLPDALRLLISASRLFAIGAFLVATLYAMPRGWAPAVPFVLVGAALALGWTARDLLRDLLAGVIITTEGRFLPDQRIRYQGHAGVIQEIGFRSLVVVDDDGVRLTIPNRRLLEEAVATDNDPFAPVEVYVHVAKGAGAGHVRQILEELALLSPYVAPSRPPHVYRDPDKADVWIVEARLIHARYARSFRGALVELADEVLGESGRRRTEE